MFVTTGHMNTDNTVKRKDAKEPKPVKTVPDLIPCDLVLQIVLVKLEFRKME